MDPETPSHHRMLFIALAVATSGAIFFTTERCFGQADVRNAIALVHTLRAHPEADTLPEVLAKRHTDGDPMKIGWGGMLTDNFYGVVRVRAVVPGAGEPMEYLFDVSLTAQRVHPANERAREMMESLRNAASSVLGTTE